MEKLLFPYRPSEIPEWLRETVADTCELSALFRENADAVGYADEIADWRIIAQCMVEAAENVERVLKAQHQLRAVHEQFHRSLEETK